jgi:hypothetical protein
VPLRVVLDYRGVNARSMRDRYSIKEVRECIDEIGSGTPTGTPASI